MKKTLVFLLSILMMCSMASFADALSAASSEVVVKSPEVIVMGSAKNAAVVSMVLTNKSNNVINVVAANSDVALETQLHKTIDGKMVQVKNIEILPQGHDDLQKNGFHVMLIGLKSPLTSGQVLPVTLILSDGSSIAVSAKVD